MREIESNEKEVERLLYREEIYEKQRSRSEWLRSGDRNTKYFHSKATRKKRKNYITWLLNENGQWCSGQDKMVRILENYFRDVF